MIRDFGALSIKGRSTNGYDERQQRVNVRALLDAREALKGAPDAAKFTWRASCKWQSGTHSGRR
jgi:hypothetical protein